MTSRVSSILLFACMLLLATSCAEDSAAVFKEYRTVFQIGDEPNWATKDLNDRHWKKDLTEVPDGQLFWSRTKIDILKAPESVQPYGLELEAYGEYEIFWDGVLIGKNGNPGQEAELPPEGELWITYSIPVHLTQKGRHVLALRLSNYYYPDHVGNFELQIDDNQKLFNDRLVQNSYMHIFAGVFLIAAIYFLFLFLSNKKEYLTLVFSISCLLFFGLTMTHFVRTTIPIHYSDHVFWLEVITCLLFGISFLIPLYFSMQFPYPKRKILMGIYTAVLLFFFSIEHHLFNYTILNMAVSLLVFSIGIALYAVYKKEKGALLVLLTLLLCIFIRYTFSFNLSLFTGFSLILLNMLYLLTIRIKEQRLAYETSLVQSTRLRLELLKKNIQPHFLMNTLTSLIDWIEESPKKGVQFIEALAKEFDLLSQMENKTLVPLAHELALCRTHLEIMAYRKEVRYTLEEVGLDRTQKIPPGILHTLLENGITHSLPRDDNSIAFTLSYEADGGRKTYTFLTYAEAVSQDVQCPKEGTGIQYIKARLSESYQERWQFSSERTPHGWKNVITLYS